MFHKVHFVKSVPLTKMIKFLSHWKTTEDVIQKKIALSKDLGLSIE